MYSVRQSDDNDDDVGIMPVKEVKTQLSKVVILEA
jgi:hypothetical protein